MKEYNSIVKEEVVEQKKRGKFVKKTHQYDKIIFVF